MEQLIAHLFGDYILQNHWMAQNKVKSWFPALVHATLYTLPFLLITQSHEAIGVIWGSHLIIDRFRLARFWQEWYGVGCSGRFWVSKTIIQQWEAGASFDTGEPNPDWQDAPDWLKVWLLIIIDNTVHLTINYFSIMYL